MRHLVRTRTVQAAVCLLATAGACAAAADPWSFEAVREHPRWVEFKRHVAASYVVSVPESQLQAGCSQGLAAGSGKAAGEPVGACIEGALRELGGRSSYLAVAAPVRETAASRRASASIGLELDAKQRGEPLVVFQVIRGSPADLAGIRAGDRIETIDWVDTRPLSMEETISAMRGEEWSVARVSLVRAGSAEPQVMFAKRLDTRVPGASVRPLAGNLAYARIPRFAESTPIDLAQRLAPWRERGNPPPAGLVLDLRANGGGSFESLIDTASVLTPVDEPVVAVRSRHGVELRRAAMPRNLPATLRAVGWRPDWFTQVPIVVLVDERTGAAAEALAQLLREARGARLLGRQTAGAPELHTRFTLEGGAVVVLATANLESPQGVQWPRGLVPDQVLQPQGPVQFGEDGDAWVAQAGALLQAGAAPAPSRP